MSFSWNKIYKIELYNSTSNKKGKALGYPWKIVMKQLEVSLVCRPVPISTPHRRREKLSDLRRYFQNLPEKLKFSNLDFQMPNCSLSTFKDLQSTPVFLLTYPTCTPGWTYISWSVPFPRLVARIPQFPSLPFLPGHLQKYSPTIGVPISFRWVQLSWTAPCLKNGSKFPKSEFISCRIAAVDQKSIWNQIPLAHLYWS